MRIRGGLIILIAVVGLLGCRSTGKDGSKDGSKAGDSAALGGKSPEALPPDVGGVIYGRVKDNYNQPVSKAVIEVVDLDDPQPAGTKFEVATHEDGNFDIPGLKPRRRYRLVVHVDGSTLYGVAEVTTPETHIVIRLVDDPEAKVPARTSSPDILPEKAKTANPTKVQVPQVPLGPPSKDEPNPNGNTGRPANGYDPSRIVDGSRGFETASPRPSPPSVSIQPPPPSEPGPDSTQRVPPIPAPVTGDGKGPPSCALSGDRLSDFALYDLDKKTYRYRTNAAGSVVLLFFWSSTDGPSLEYLSELEKLHELYNPYKLQVVGVAYEQGDSNQQSQGVRSARGRYGLRYTQLLGGGGDGACPVRSAFGVVEFPTLVVLNRDGVITYRAGRLPVGDSETSRTQKSRKLQEIEQKVREALRVTDP